MWVQWLLVISLFLVAVPATAKKLYKYQDEKGLWHFTDKPPNTAQKVEVRQLKPTQKQWVRLEKTGDNSHPDFYAFNQYPGPVELEVDWEAADNVISTPALPQRFVLEPGESAPLFNVSGVGDALSWKFTLQYRYVIGRPLGNYVSTMAYLPPIAPGGRFQITQAFGGEFSHQDEQNRYAVDIMMPVGTPIYAARVGMVMEVDDDYFKSGTEQAYANKANSIRILHDDGSMAVYAHLELEKAQVRPGLQVQAGELIGYSGNTGFTTGPHLHFAVQINQGMQLVSVPFQFANSEGAAFEPRVGVWLEGFKP